MQVQPTRAGGARVQPAKPWQMTAVSFTTFNYSISDGGSPQRQTLPFFLDAAIGSLFGLVAGKNTRSWVNTSINYRLFQDGRGCPAKGVVKKPTFFRVGTPSFEPIHDGATKLLSAGRPREKVGNALLIFFCEEPSAFCVTAL
ncbi:hypothetical protein CIHG_09508 [Coccidioides immitis H538.4]|uniref:Uncharacterized protein n=2 Tax=Coccidioides immitis TaxID=5501 RepID=A0A0J8S4H9_COCIT|nr:hypothetical protein CIRG_03822 [Coccidioides immitis RMSCC 2394]KMU91701.1 hypothetical protein CIHG_09508 [Coccidioides immitis H538.4]